MAEKTVQRKIRVCDITPGCPGEAVGTCPRCAKDWCIAHGVLMRVLVFRAQEKPTRKGEEDVIRPITQRVEWKREEARELDPCWPCYQVLRKQIPTGHPVVPVPAAPPAEGSP